MLRLLPVDPVSRIVGAFGTDEARASAKATIGLDRSFGEQLGSFLEGLLTLDFGQSFVTREPVCSELGDRIPVTLQLIGIGFILALLIAIPLGRYIAAKVGGRTEKVTTVYALFAGAQPDFWWGLIFLFVFFFKFRWFPAPLGQLSPTEIAPDGPTRFIFIDTLVHGQFDLFVSALKPLRVTDHHADVRADGPDPQDHAAIGARRSVVRLPALCEGIGGSRQGGFGG